MRSRPLPLMLSGLVSVLVLGSSFSACSSTSSSTSADDAQNASSTTYGKSASFDVRHELKVMVPDGAKKVRVWFAMPQSDPAQTISNFKVETPATWRTTQDSAGNDVVYAEMSNPTVKDFTIVETFRVVRREVNANADPSKAHALSADDRARLAAYLAPNQHVIIDDRISKLANEIVGDETNPVIAAHKIYDWELQNVDYWVKDPKNKKASPVGSTDYCLTNKTGNCTDFHSLWASIARAKGIPTRIVYGVFLKKELDGKDVDSSYHCWPEFYAEGLGWIPHDVAVADIFVGDFKIDADNDEKVRRTTADGYAGADPQKVAYYFGNLEERRVKFSSGRDLVLDPKPDANGGVVNALPKAYVEVDGKAHPEKDGWTRKLTYAQSVEAK